MKILTITQLGNPVLRQKTYELTEKEIKSTKVQNLIKDMQHTLLEKKLGIGLAAPQVGENLSLAVLAIRPNSTRPDIEPFDLVLINPTITETKGYRKQLWEGCISAGSQGKADLFAKVPRYKQVKVRFYDEKGALHHETYKGLQAHVIQHETDHLNGILFVDRVKDTSTFMTYREYKKRIVKK